MSFVEYYSYDATDEEHMALNYTARRRRGRIAATPRTRRGARSPRRRGRIAATPRDATGGRSPRPQVLYRLSAAVNVFGVLVVNKCYTNAELAQRAPTLFSQESQFLIQLWGAAYEAGA